MRTLIQPRALGRSGAVRALRATLEGQPAAVSPPGPGFRERFSAQGKAPGKVPMSVAWRAAGKAVGKVDTTAMLRSTGVCRTPSIR